MRRSAVFFVTLAASSIACSTAADERALAPTEVTAPLRLDAAEGNAFGHDKRSPNHLRTSLSGAEEIPARATPASGRARFKLRDDGSAIDYTLEVEDIRNVVFAHIHFGAATQNGPVVTFLYGPVPAAGGPISGRIASGTITASSLIGPFAGQPLSRLLEAIARDSAYVNVHTNAGVPGTPLQPGNYPGGEVRGQLDDAR